MNDVIGIVGGMGSRAAASFFQQLLNHSPAIKDQEYMEVLLHNNTRIPDRTEGILGHGDDPYPELLRSVKLLENGGATVIVLACITAHHYYGRLEKSLTKAKMFHIVKETADYVCSKHPGLKNVGILATEGTLKTALWQNELQRRGINTVVLSDRHQAEYFNEVVYGRNGLKAGCHHGEMKNKLLTGCRQLADRGAEAIIGGCSELHLLISEEDVPVPFVDAIRVTAAKLSDLYYGNSGQTSRLTRQ